MSNEKRLIDWNEFKRHCPDSICCPHYENGPCLPKTCKYWQALSVPMEAPGDQALEYMTTFSELAEYISSLRKRNAELARGRERAIREVGIERVKAWFCEFEENMEIEKVNKEVESE